MNLEEQLLNPNKILVQKTQMGTTEAYLGSVTFEWLANRVSFASELPLFKDKIDPITNNIIRDKDTIELIQQRPLDWSRQSIITQYLIAQKNHKFSPILVVISPSWVDNPAASEWENHNQANQSSINFNSLDQNNTIGFLDIAQNLSIFALDGQHRLMGIKGLITFLKIGQLPRYTKDKKPLGLPLTINDFIETYKLDKNYLQNLAQESIGIEFIPAVISGETREQAKRRIRSIFVHINLMSVPLSKGQLSLLNENSGFSIIARKIAVTHPLLKASETKTPRINWDGANISSKSTVLTTLQALQDMSEKYLEPKFPHWKPQEKGRIVSRPNELELAEGLEHFTELFDYLYKLPSYQKIDSENDIIKIRRFSHERLGGEANILFRPVGQIALAQALGILVFKKGFSLQAIFSKLYQFDTENGFSNIDFPQSSWYGVFYDPNKRRILVSGRDLAAKLIIYMLGGIDDILERAYLRESLAKSRTIEGKAISFQGTFVNPRELGLPPLL